MIEVGQGGCGRSQEAPRCTPRKKLLGILKTHFGVALPVSLAVRMRRFRWSVALRYETGRRDTGETKDLLNTCRHIYRWVKGEMS